LSVLSRGTESHIMAPELFARDPSEWLRLAQRIEATMLAGPSSAWAAALDAAQRRPEGLDLSGIGRATFSMEMIDADTVERLIELGAQFGLRPEVVGTVYGMSEGGATSTMPGEAVQFDLVDLDELVENGRAVPATADTVHVKRIAGCGRAIPGLELRVANESGALPDRQVGEIQFSGPSLMDSYVGPAADDAFVDGWLRTGDLGYLIDGQVFVTGRVKELIVHLGRKYHPEDIEQAAARAAGVMASACVAFSPIRGAEGDVVVAIEVQDPEPDLETRIRAAVTSAVGLVVTDVVFLPPGSLPKAPNGKQQRIAARTMYAAGTLAAP
jgi:fatty-acyl-CoA synthase